MLPGAHRVPSGMLRIRLTCLRRRSHKNATHELADILRPCWRASLQLAASLIPAGPYSMTQVTPGKSRVRENQHARIRESESQMAELLDHP